MIVIINIKELFQKQGYLTREQLKKYSESKKISYKKTKTILSDLGMKIYDIKPEKKLKSTFNEYEVCVLCGKKTNIKVSEKIENRYHYVSGVGQLCEECHREL